jgi:uncharacterized protein (DUF2267 family)
MSTNGLAVFDSTVQQTNVWLKDIDTRLHSDDRHFAYIALRATLHALRDRLTPVQAAHLGAQLPMLLRGVYYEGWRMTDTPTRERHLDAFLDRVRSELTGQGGADDPERIARAVFETLADQIDLGETRKVVDELPVDLKRLWPETAQHH